MMTPTNCRNGLLLALALLIATSYYFLSPYHFSNDLSARPLKVSILDEADLPTAFSIDTTQEEPPLVAMMPPAPSISDEPIEIAEITPPTEVAPATMLPLRWTYPTQCKRILDDTLTTKSSANVSSLANFFGNTTARGSYDRYLNDNSTYETHTIRLTSYDDDTCAIDKVLTHDAVLSCLQQRNIMFAGDSTMRFQYLDLLHYLRFGLWNSGYSYNAKPQIPEATSRYTPRSFHPPLRAPYDKAISYGPWANYFKEVCASLAPFCIADSWRQDPSTWNELVEVWYYRDSRLNIRINFFSVFGLDNGTIAEQHRIPFHFHDPAYLNATCDLPSAEQQHQDAADSETMPLLGCKQSGCQPGECRDDTSPNKESAWSSFDKFAGLLLAVQIQEPDILVLNSGIWSSCNTAACIKGARKFEDEVSKLPKPPRLIWKTTSAASTTGRQDDLESMLFRSEGSQWHKYDARAASNFVMQLTQELNINKTVIAEDHLHWKPIVNTFLNQYLLASQLCSADTQLALDEKRLASMM